MDASKLEFIPVEQSEPAESSLTNARNKDQVAVSALSPQETSSSSLTVSSSAAVGQSPIQTVAIDISCSSSNSSDGRPKSAQTTKEEELPRVNELQSPKSTGTNPNNTSTKNSSSVAGGGGSVGGGSGSQSSMRNNASSGSGGGGANRDSLKQRKSTPVDSSTTAGSNPIHHIAASGSPTLRGPTGSVGVDTSRRASTGGPANNTSSRNTTKPCCFCWCCCYRCSW